MITFSLNAQTKKYTSDIEEKIRLVENNLAEFSRVAIMDCRLMYWVIFTGKYILPPIQIFL